jgi:hypothetical protein
MGNELLTYAVMLDLFIVVYLQFVIMVIELEKVLSQELKCLCSKDYHCSVGVNHTENYGC